MAGLLSTLRGVLGSLFQIGGTLGPQLSAVSGLDLAHRNATNAAYIASSALYFGNDISANLPAVGTFRSNVATGSIMTAVYTGGIAGQYVTIAQNNTNTIIYGVDGTFVTGLADAINIVGNSAVTLYYGPGGSLGVNVVNSGGVYFNIGPAVVFNDLSSAPATPPTGQSKMWGQGSLLNLLDSFGRTTLLSEQNFAQSATYTNATTGQVSVTALGFTIEPGETWNVDIEFTAETSAVSGQKMQITAPTGCVIEGWFYLQTTSATPIAPTRITAVNTPVTTAVYTVVTTPLPGRASFTISHNGATAGPCTLSTACVSSSVTATILPRGKITANLALLH